MNKINLFEIQIYGEVCLTPTCQTDDIQEALSPLWEYLEISNYEEGMRSLYEEEPGIHIDLSKQRLKFFWTVLGDLNIRPALEKVGQKLSSLSISSSTLEVYCCDVGTSELDDESETETEVYMLVFIGPEPKDILKLQHTILATEMERNMKKFLDKEDFEKILDEMYKVLEFRQANPRSAIRYTIASPDEEPFSFNQPVVLKKNLH